MILSNHFVYYQDSNLKSTDSAASKKSTEALLLKDNSYDTVTSFHDIEQDDHKYYKEPIISFQTPKYFSKLGKINELPSKNGKSQNNDKI